MRCGILHVKKWSLLVTKFQKNCIFPKILRKICEKCSYVLNNLAFLIKKQFGIFDQKVQNMGSLGDTFVIFDKLH